MQDILGQIFVYLWGIWRFRWVAIFGAWIIAIAGWIYVVQMPERYTASARIHIDSNSVLRPLLRGLAIQPDINQRLDLMARTLLSRPNLEKLMRLSDLDLQAKTDARKDEVLDMLRDNITLGAIRGNTSLYTVNFRNEDRDLAKRVVQSLITVFVETTLGDNREDSSDAQDFLDKQIEEYAKRMADAESKIAAFKQEHVEILPGVSGGYYEKLTATRDQLKTAELDLKEAENTRTELQRQLNGEEPVYISGISGMAGSAEIDQRINSLQANLDALLTKYTDKHPEVIRTREIINELQEQKTLDGQKTAENGQADYSGLMANPFYQEMKTRLSTTETRVAELKVRVSEYKKRVSSLESLMKDVPEIETQLKEMERQYGVVQQKHAELITRRESARFTEDVETKANDFSFRVIDPPFVPLKPDEPNKLALNSGVFILSLGLGGAIALLMSLLHPVVIDRRSLANVTGLPVLGTVSYVPSTSERRHESVRNVQFMLLFLAFVFVFAMVNFGHEMLGDIVSRLST